MIFGYRWLLILVAVLYGLAFLVGRAHWRRPAAASAPAPVSVLGQSSG
jgi:hypothetical protein